MATQPRLSTPSSLSSDPGAPKVRWGDFRGTAESQTGGIRAGDEARRQNIAAGHQRIRERMGGYRLGGAGGGAGGPQQPRPSGWQWESPSDSAKPSDPGQAVARRPGPNWRLYQAPQTPPTVQDKTGRLGKLGAMFHDPAVRRQVLDISDKWELSNQIRRQGMHGAIRQAFGLKQFSSHPVDEINARLNDIQRRMGNTNPNAGMNPNHFEAEQEEI